MKRLYGKACVLAIALLVVVCVGWSMSLIKANYTKSSSNPSPQIDADKKPMTLKNPCWFRLPEGIDKTPEGKIAFEKYVSREKFGYSDDTPISEAVKIFNQEAYCSGPDPKRHPLTEDEVVAAVTAEMSRGLPDPTSLSSKVTLKERQATLEGISKSRIMPKGSLLVGTGHYELVDINNVEKEGSIEIDCWMIYLYFGMGKKSTDEGIMDQNQVLLIRKTYFSAKRKTR